MRKFMSYIYFYGSIIAIVAVVLSFPILTYTSKDVVESTLIKDKERIVQTDDSYYLVYTDKGVYKNADSLLYFKFDSSDLYNELEPGMTCDLDVYWFRVPFFSMYENIVSVKNCVEGES